MKIVSNTIVHNEENFIWFALMSIVDHVDKVLVWDTGSTDKTVDIIQEVKKIKGDKIEFKEYGKVDNLKFTKARQEMLEESQCDWIILLDGDEVWWEDSILELVKTIKKKGSALDAVVVPFINSLGDVYHHQDESYGEYNIMGKKGHLTVRAINRKISGLHVDKPYGQEGYYDRDSSPVQELKRLFFLKTPYLHLTHLKRSSKSRRINKIKYQLGQRLDKSIRLPEVFFREYPKFIENPLKTRGLKYIMRASLKEPAYLIKKKIKSK